MSLFITLIFSILAVQAIAQTGAIKGTVTASDGKPAEFVNVILGKTGKASIVNDAGNYTLNKIPAGTYTLTASFTGLPF